MTFLGYYLYAEGDRPPAFRTTANRAEVPGWQLVAGSVGYAMVLQTVRTDSAINHRFIVFGSVALTVQHQPALGGSGAEEAPTIERNKVRDQFA